MFTRIANPKPATLANRYARWQHKVRGTTLPCIHLIAHLAKGPLTMPQIEALSLHRHIGGLIWPGHLAAFHREEGQTYALTPAGHTYLEKLTADGFLPA